MLTTASTSIRISLHYDKDADDDDYHRGKESAYKALFGYGFCFCVALRRVNYFR